jgi:hypothetical protein
VVDRVGGGEDFGLIDVVYAQGFKDLCVYSLACLLQMALLRASLDLIFKTGWSGRLAFGMNRRTWHSTKCPMRAFAMTGIVTVSMISLIILGSLIRATPPWARMSAGTRSSAMTATAPASSAMRAYFTMLAVAKDVEL